MNPFSRSITIRLTVAFRPVFALLVLLPMLACSWLGFCLSLGIAVAVILSLCLGLVKLREDGPRGSQVSNVVDFVCCLQVRSMLSILLVLLECKDL